MAAINEGWFFQPSSYCHDLADGVEARLHDPLWMLARQWQFGELKADDAGSPILAHVAPQTSLINQYGAYNGNVAAYDARRIPLEAVVERESVQDVSGRSLAANVEASLFFLRLLTACGAHDVIPDYKRHYALGPLPEEQRVQWDQNSVLYATIMSGRVPDAKRLYTDFSQAFGPQGERDGALPQAPAIPEGQRGNVIQAAKAWLRWYADQGLSQPESAAGSFPWNSERMEYAFKIAGKISSKEVTLAAPEYFEGYLDWHSFVFEKVSETGAAQPPSTETLQLVPVPASYPGMPASRYWEFEDGHVNFAAAAGQSNEVALAVLLEFALIHGNDWSIVPLEMAVGSLCRIESLIVMDTFGERLRVRHCTEVDKVDSPWRMYCISSRPDKEGRRTYPMPDLFFLPPVVAAGFESEPIEEVKLIRDEMANMAWAVERVVEGPAGLPLDRYESFQETQRQSTRAEPVPSSAAPDGMYRYRLGTEVPDYWIPFVPDARDRTDVRSLRLRRAAMPRITKAGLQGLIQPLGQILEAGYELLLYSEEVPREGATLTRAYQYTRWIDGTSHLWLSRRKRIGKGEGSSGLRFDILESR